VDEEVMVTELRHKNLLKEALDILKNVSSDIKRKVPVDIVSIDLTNSADLLGQIIGESVKEDIIEKIFKSFCLGK